MSGEPHGRRWAAVIAAVIVFAAGCGGSDRLPPSAAEQVPQLAAVLQRVDSALAERRFAAARQQLKTLKAQVVAARDAGDLREPDADRVLSAIARLMALLPGPASASPQTPKPDSPSTSASSKPSAPVSSRPGRPESTLASPSVPSTPSTPATSGSPSPTPSPTSSPTPAATPTDSATRDAGPTASPSPAS